MAAAALPNLGYEDSPRGRDGLAVQAPAENRALHFGEHLSHTGSDEISSPRPPSGLDLRTGYRGPLTRTVATAIARHASLARRNKLQGACLLANGAIVIIYPWRFAPLAPQ